MNVKIWYNRLCIFIVIFFLFIPLIQMPVLAANSIHRVDIQVELHQDGSATVTEFWNITMSEASNTEFYVAKHNLDNMEIQNLQVQEIFEDGSNVNFETKSSWNVNASREEKAGTCGLVQAKGGYEICWGFGALGSHSYSVTYTITNLVKSYEGGDAMSFNFLSDASGGADSLDIRIEADSFDFEYPDTRVWVFGYEAESSFENGGITILGQGRFRQSDYAAVLLVFEKGMLVPTDIRTQSIEEIIDLNMEGSIWADTSSASTLTISTSWPFYAFFSSLLMPITMIIMVVFIYRASKRNRKVKQAMIPRQYSAVPPCRELPFNGSLAATFSRLSSMNQVDDGSVIGCHLLAWIRTGQARIVKKEVGTFRKREEDAIYLYPAPNEMPRIERRLYKMLFDAAGPDCILQNKKFERWSRNNYSQIGSWLSSYRSMGDKDLDQMGAYTTVPVKRLFGLVESQQRQITSYGEEMTGRMFGFFRYLQDFTLLNEREAHEVQLWDQYLIFAQLFGIADSVASQFKNLYPNYFIDPNSYMHDGYDPMDILITTHVSRSFSRAMYSGYRSGVSAASSGDSSNGGGGSSSSSGGGGGSSGGGGAGGR